MRWLKSLAIKRKTPDIPTVDYYFLGAMETHVSPDENCGAERPMARLGPHTFAHAGTLVIIRYATPDELVKIEAGSWTRVFYVIDDMLPIAAQCDELPETYRAKLADFARDVLPRILTHQPTIVAPSQAILDLFPERPRELLDPCILSVADEFSHFPAGSSSPAAPLRLAFLGTRSHARGIEFLVSVLEGLAAKRANVTTTLFFGKHLPRALSSLVGIDNRPALDWPQFRQFLARERYHVLLAPLPLSPFNAGRSITKIFDAAAVGACGLFSDRAPFRGAVTSGENGLLLADDPARWVAEILRLSENPSDALRLAKGGAALARQLGDPQRLRNFWIERMGLKSSKRFVTPFGDTTKSAK